MRESIVPNGIKRGISHNKSEQVFRTKYNRREEGIKRKILLFNGRWALPERSLTNGTSDQPVNLRNECGDLFHANRSDLD
jgi:hypothetical protein